MQQTTSSALAEQLRIGRHVAELVENGATLQLSIVAIPDTVLQALTDRSNLGVHSEIFSDGVLDLVERGVITGACKTVDRGKIVASFVVGSQRLLDSSMITRWWRCAPPITPTIRASSASLSRWLPYTAPFRWT